MELEYNPKIVVNCPCCGVKVHEIPQPLPFRTTQEAHEYFEWRRSSLSAYCEKCELVGCKDEPGACNEIVRHHNDFAQISRIVHMAIDTCSDDRQALLGALKMIRHIVG